MQASSGLLLAFSNALGPRTLNPLMGERGVIRAGLLAFAFCLLAMGLAPTGKFFAAAVACASLSTFCLPGLTSIIAHQADAMDGGAMLAALDSLSTLDRLVAYKGMSRAFAWGIGQGSPGVPFFLGTACVIAGWASFESAGQRTGSGSAEAEPSSEGAPGSLPKGEA